MIPRLGDGNINSLISSTDISTRLENDSPSRGRKPKYSRSGEMLDNRLENDSPSRGRKLSLDSMKEKDLLV